METSQATIELDHRSDQALIRVAIIDERSVVANELVKRLTIRNDGQLHDENAASVVCRKIEADTLKDLDIQDVIIFSPLTTVRKRLGRESLLPNVEYAKSTIKAARTAAVRHFVLLSSAEVYGSDYSNPGMVTEDRSSIQKRSNRIADAWSEIESYASGMIADNQHRLSIVRPCFVLNGDTREFASRLFSSWFAFPFAGYDPCMQLLSLEDFATAICRIIRNGASGEFNVAPNEVVSLRNALRRARIWRIPIPHCVQRCLRAFCDQR